MPSKKERSRDERTRAPSASDIVRRLDAELVKHDGKTISWREAYLTLLYMRSIKGNISASIELQRIRAACRADKPAERFGYLVVPEPMSDEAFAKYAYEQQAKFRDANYGKDDY